MKHYVLMVEEKGIGYPMKNIVAICSNLRKLKKLSPNPFWQNSKKDDVYCKTTWREGIRYLILLPPYLF